MQEGADMRLPDISLVNLLASGEGSALHGTRRLLRYLVAAGSMPAVRHQVEELELAPGRLGRLGQRGHDLVVAVLPLAIDVHGCPYRPGGPAATAERRCTFVAPKWGTSKTALRPLESDLQQF